MTIVKLPFYRTEVYFTASFHGAINGAVPQIIKFLHDVPHFRSIGADIIGKLAAHGE